jgi:hypothetical protein
LSALHLVKKPEASGFLYRECQRQLKLPEAEQILCLENLAHVARWQGKIAEAIEGLEEALRRWERRGPREIPSQIIQHSWLAGLYLSKGDNRSAERHKSSLLSILQEFESKAHLALQAHIFLEAADTANQYGDNQFESIMLKKGLSASLKNDKLQDYTLYFQQSLGDISSCGRRQSDYGPGRFLHPDTREWRMKRIGNNFYEPVV